MRIHTEHDRIANLRGDFEKAHRRIMPVLAQTQQVDFQRRIRFCGAFTQAARMLLKCRFVAVVIHKIGMCEIGICACFQRFAHLIDIRAE